MKGTYFVCLFLCLTTTFLLSQSNPVPLTNQTASVVAPIGVSQLPSGRVRAAARQTAPAQTQGPIFAPAVVYGSGGSEAYSVAVADVNGDGKPDIVVANNSTNSVCVLLGNGDGTFQAAVSYGSGGYNPDSVAVADVNGDGKPDLVVANLCANVGNVCTGIQGSVGVLLGNGDGTFQAAVSYVSGATYARSVAVADVNGDGIPDILVANSATPGNPLSGSVGVLLGNGDGTFQAVVSYGSGGYNGLSVAVADVNGDGKPDLLVANECVDSNCATGSMGVLLGNGDGTFQAAVSYGSGGVGATSVAVVDVNGDGKLDLLVANTNVNNNNGNGVVGVLLGNGDGTFQAAVSYSSGGVGATSVAVADVNGDGKLDLVVANQCADVSCVNGSLGVLLGNGDGTFQAAVSYGSGGPYAFSVAVADVNGDGKPDLVVADYASSVSVLINISTYPTTTALASSANPSAFGQPVTFTATVTKQFGKGTPTGTFTFTYGSTTLCNAVTLVGGAATCAYSALPVGSDIVTATYSGDANFSSSSASLNQTVLATTTTTLATSANPSMSGSSVTFTATVTTSGSKTPTGTVTFYDGATALGTGTLNGSGIATYTTSSLAVGQHSMTAVYGGDANNAGSTSSVLTQTVNAADFALTSNPTSATVTAGQSGTFTLTVTPQGSFTSPISFSCSGLPALAGCTFKPASVTPNSSTATSTLTITTTAQTASLASPYGRRSPLYAMWLVLPAMLLGMVGMAAPNRRKLLSFCLAFLLVGGCLLQAACGGGSNGGGGGGGGGTPPGTYTITVTGAAGSTQHTTAVTLTVQ